MALEDMHTAGLCLEGTSWFFMMRTATSNRHCQIQGTLVASLEDGRFWICTHMQNFKSIKKMSLLKSQVQVGNIARISTSDTLSLRQGGGCAGWRGGSPTPLSNCRNMGHCVDHSPSLRVVQVPRVLWEMLMGHPDWSMWLALLTSSISMSRLRAQGGAGWGACPSHLLAPPPD